MIEKAYAKINLTLNVIGQREDGYHDLETVMLPLLLHDSINITISKQRSDFDFVVCDDFVFKITKYNLCHKMLNACRKKWDIKETFSVILHKNIFIQAGLGGGSADAAAVLRAVIKLMHITDYTDEDIKELCESCGSDVYFQYYNQTALVEGKGDRVTFITTPFKPYVLLVKPEDGTSTADIFLKFSDYGDFADYPATKVKEYIGSNIGLKELQPLIHNSLLETATSYVPTINVILEQLKEFGFECYNMCGSGSCCFALTHDKKFLKKAYKYFSKLGYDVEMTKVI
ncbi:MAG TPA: 4-(cytidine 5'-diphospho)-2-C-methyl-D-erythritol kinase [Candidatus Onthovivens sp.]|nr:4-(cytidine 5'-diphospho)-2-C-methyl-D-erythritol kinase [Candidatus Onthovivens sp.]